MASYNAFWVVHTVWEHDLCTLLWRLQWPLRRRHLMAQLVFDRPCMSEDIGMKAFSDIWDAYKIWRISCKTEGFCQLLRGHLKLIIISEFFQKLLEIMRNFVFKKLTCFFGWFRDFFRNNFRGLGSCSSSFSCSNSSSFGGSSWIISSAKTARFFTEFWNFGLSIWAVFKVLLTIMAGLIFTNVGVDGWGRLARFGFN